MEVGDVSGRIVARYRGQGMPIMIWDGKPGWGNAGVYLMVLTTDQGSLSRKFIRP